MVYQLSNKQQLKCKTTITMKNRRSMHNLIKFVNDQYIWNKQPWCVYELRLIEKSWVKTYGTKDEIVVFDREGLRNKGSNITW